MRWIAGFVLSLGLSSHATGSHHAPAMAPYASEIAALDLESLRGKVVVIELMETWCGPCKQAVPTLNKWHARFADAGVHIVIASPESEDTLRRYRDTNNVEANMAIDVDRQADRRFDVTVYPTYVVLDREGQPRGQFKGTDSLSKVEALFTSLTDSPTIPDGIRFD